MVSHVPTSNPATPPARASATRHAQVIHAGLPIKGSDTGDYLVRNLVGFDAKNRLVAIGAYVEKGMPIMFCKRDERSAREDLHRMLDSISADLDGEADDLEQEQMYAHLGACRACRGFHERVGNRERGARRTQR